MVYGLNPGAVKARLNSEINSTYLLAQVKSAIASIESMIS